jgi:hypothetical protein
VEHGGSDSDDDTEGTDVAGGDEEVLDGEGVALATNGAKPVALKMVGSCSLWTATQHNTAQHCITQHSPVQPSTSLRHCTAQLAILPRSMACVCLSF